MSKFSEMAAPLAGKFGLTIKDAEQFLLQMTEVLNEGLREDKQVKVKGLGTFKVTTVSARKSVNVNTGEPIVIGSRDKITFTPEASLRDRVNSPFAQFETVVVNDGIDLEVSPVSSIQNEEVQNEEIQAEEILNGDNITQEVSIEEEKSLNEVSDTKEEGLVEKTDKPSSLIHPEQPLPNHTDQVIPSHPEPSSPPRDLSRPTSKIKYGTVAILLLLVLFGAFYFLRDATTGNKVERQDVGNVKQEKADTPKSRPDSTQALSAATDNPSPVDYDSYPIMRYGAYEFDGVAAEVTIKKGQTIATISKTYFGPSPGADQYIEAFNGKRDFKEGDVIKIPKLVLKKKNKK